MEHRIPGSQTLRDLPMVVYLQGDEKFIQDFAIDADKAMDYLGIKRSRLTQISGRELRVGRIRKDRYIRPVYRVKDLEDYKSWTRATATSQSSSKVMEKAIHSLSDQWNEFKLESQFVWQDMAKKLKRDVLQGQLSEKSLMKRLFEKTAREQNALMKGLCSRIDQLEDVLLKVQSLTHKHKAKVDKELSLIHDVQESLHLEVHRLSGLFKGAEDRRKQSGDDGLVRQKRLETLLISLVEKVEQQGLELQSLKKDQAALSQSLEKANQKLDTVVRDVAKDRAWSRKRLSRSLARPGLKVSKFRQEHLN
ncbi:hypothetical protein [Pseudobacteriovorax antillogorgiicola]|uniref:Uncharacterized protein n=1 Tax=Pseudobacteriovorax antillogorgiicola TaxID=1513793 RepID=A0A1Y6B8N9_9BACT|nr:hypothetical protein [Pseudobacteriovorax antillogorgiicola]TCS58618.1 hypothetical protein EDD56_102131 [Pseudobacteriovorax antillogorgiicola]SME96812.1 hypothetical protein SAMN06296036_102312 [Pseudobacteriovorax antillogorgiicola]